MRLHQTVNTMLKGDATSDQVLLIRRWLHDLGFESDIFSIDCADELKGEVKCFHVAELEGESLVIFHHTMGSDLLDELTAREIPLMLIYHNITPPQFFSDSDFVLINQLHRGRQQLDQIRPITRLALSDSPYSEQELLSIGFENTGVLPIVLDTSHYDLPVDDALFRSCRAEGPVLLFVGRLSPNKRQEDLIKLLYFYRRIEPQARLILVGSTQAEDYVAWLQDLVADLNLSEAVTFAGHVSQQEMITYFKAADLYVSMSEHEGFGKPLIESMYLQLPVLAYASTAVPSTLGNACILFREKDFEALAELVDMMVQDQDLRCRLVDGQNERVQAFLEPSVHQQLLDYLSALNLR